MGQVVHGVQLRVRRLVILDEVERRGPRSKSMSIVGGQDNNYATSNTTRKNEKYAYLQQAVNSFNRGNGRAEIPSEVNHSPELKAHLKHLR
jgi:hypothetical protein